MHRSTGVAAGMLFAAGLFPASVAAQAVTLRIHPVVGDTLHTRLEQRMDVSAVMHRNGRTSTKSETTSVAIDTRTIVRSSFATSTLVLTIVDSADLHTSDAQGSAQMAASQRMMRGQQLLLQLAVDGSVQSARDGRGRPVPHEIAEAMSAMPAVFPRRPVREGEQWSREMPLPSGGPLGARGTGYVNAVFRLDSLARGGRLAFVSMRGDIRPASDDEGVRLTGSISGAMRLDRARGWMTDSDVTVVIRSVVTPPRASGGEPMTFVTRLTQRLRTMDKR